MRLRGGRTGKRAVICENLVLTGNTQSFGTEIWFDDRIAVLGANGSGKSTFLRLLAGEQVPHEGHQPTHSYAAFSPTTDGKHLYVSFGSRGVYCYDLDGQLQWQRDLGQMHTRLGWGEHDDRSHEPPPVATCHPSLRPVVLRPAPN